MKAVTVGQTVEYNGRQGFVTHCQDKYVACVWFLVPPGERKGRYRYLDVKALKAKPKIKPLRLNGQAK